MPDESDNNQNKRKSVSGLAVPAGIFIGMGIGFLTGNLVAWLFLGLGAGFLAMMAILAFKREW